jgi:hypothetical protein
VARIREDFRFLFFSLARSGPNRRNRNSRLGCYNHGYGGGAHEHDFMTNGAETAIKFSHEGQEKIHSDGTQRFEYTVAIVEKMMNSKKCRKPSPVPVFI